MAMVPLSYSKHSNLGLGELDLRIFADHTNLPVYVHEVSMLAVDFPLFLAMEDDVISIRLLCSVNTDGGCALIDKDGKWLGRHVPLAIQQHPFSLLPVSEERITVCIDENSPRLHPNGQLLFTGSEPSELLNQISENLKRLHQSGRATQAILDLLKEKELIIPWEPTVSFQGKESTLTGLLQIDEAALNRLGDTDWLALKKVNALGLVYAQLLSMRNLNTLIILQNSKLVSSRTEDSELSLNLSDDKLELNFDSDSDSLNFDNF